MSETDFFSVWGLIHPRTFVPCLIFLCRSHLGFFSFDIVVVNENSLEWKITTIESNRIELNRIGSNRIESNRIGSDVQSRTMCHSGIKQCMLENSRKQICNRQGIKPTSSTASWRWTSADGRFGKPWFVRRESFCDENSHNCKLL